MVLDARFEPISVQIQGRITFTPRLKVARILLLLWSKLVHIQLFWLNTIDAKLIFNHILLMLDKLNHEH
jgi:hypothetical protein